MGETDITLSGFDMSTGERVTMSELVANKVWLDISLMRLIEFSRWSAARHNQWRKYCFTDVSLCQW